MSKKYHLTVVREEETLVGGEGVKIEHTSYHLSVSPENYQKIIQMSAVELADLIGIKNYSDDSHDMLEVWDGNENDIDGDALLKNLKEKHYKFQWREYRSVVYEGVVKGTTVHEAEKMLKEGKEQVETYQVLHDEPRKKEANWFEVLDVREVEPPSVENPIEKVNG